jgi:hypothetical protein
MEVKRSGEYDGIQESEVLTLFWKMHREKVHVKYAIGCFRKVVLHDNAKN